jgi:hypothetical protein
MEWPAAQTVSVSDSNNADNSLAANYSFSPDGVTIVTGSVSLNATIGAALQLFSFSKPPGQGNVTLMGSAAVNVAEITYGATAAVNVTAGNTYKVVPGANENGALLVNGTQTVALAVGTAVTITAQSDSLVFQLPNLIPAGAAYNGGGYSTANLAAGNYGIVWGADEGLRIAAGGWAAR